MTPTPDTEERLRYRQLQDWIAVGFGIEGVDSPVPSEDIQEFFRLKGWSIAAPQPAEPGPNAALTVALEKADLDWDHGLGNAALAYAQLRTAVRAALRDTPPTGLDVDDEEAALAYSALQQAIWQAATLRTETVHILAPLARYLAARLRESAKPEGRA